MRGSTAINEDTQQWSPNTSKIAKRVPVHPRTRANIDRFDAARGLGVAGDNYRLQPAVT